MSTTPFQIEPHGTWALVALKAGLGKSRLAAVLDQRQRHELVYQMAAHVIDALHRARGIDTVAVVTSSTAHADFAIECGAMPILQSADCGVSHALATAVTDIAPHQPARVLMVHGDLPLLTSIAVEDILDAGTRHQVVLAPDRHQVGTNALLCTPPAALTPCFGEHSFARHLAAASAAGIEPHVMMIEELACDVDVPADVAFVRDPGRGHWRTSTAERLKPRASRVE